MSRPGMLWWKYETGPADGTGDDAGPAWIVRPDGSDEDINGGEWITRSEAVRLATEGGFEFCQDGGWTEDEAAASVESPRSVEVQAINERLRSFGISAEKLEVEEDGLTHLWMTGSLVGERISPLPQSVAAGDKYRVTVDSVSMPTDEALAAIERLIAS